MQKLFVVLTIILTFTAGSISLSAVNPTITVAEVVAPAHDCPETERVICSLVVNRLYLRQVQEASMARIVRAYERKNVVGIVMNLIIVIALTAIIHDIDQTLDAH